VKGAEKQGFALFNIYLLVTEIVTDTNRGNDDLDEDGAESEEPFEDNNVQFSSSVCIYSTTL
jgi:hypothetical protein